MAAFRLAAEMGADGIELDVHLLADGELAVIHNHTVDATTDGRGPVSALSSADLQSLDAGAWFSPRFAGERIPTLRAVLAEVGERLLVNVEIKGPSREGLESTTVRVIEEAGMVERVIVSSFYPGCLRKVRALNPEIRLGFLYAGSIYGRLPLWAYRLLAPYDALHPAYRLVDRGYVARARRQGSPLNVWTVNDEDELGRMCDLGVSGVITNYPDRLARILAQD
jgi:glycerophosphoryl diester phosphodiesterase